MTWDTMAVTTREAEEQPFLFIVPGPGTRVVWNGATQDLLHDPGHVEIVVDRDRKILGVKPCDASAVHAIAVHKLVPRMSRHGPPSSPRWGLDPHDVGLDAALDRAGIEWPAGQQGYVRDARQDGDVVYIHIDELLGR